MVISTSGYYATGSSAAFNLLDEYSSTTSGKLAGGDYENVVFYTPDGLFDLEDKLLRGNSIHRSDEAIKRFLKRMRTLDGNDFGWFGGYGKLYGTKFRESYARFAKSLVEYQLEGHWQGHYEGMKYDARRILGDIRRIITGKQLPAEFGKKPVFNSEKTLVYSFVTAEEFYQKAREFVKDYFRMILEGENKHLILNHAVLPHNLYRIPNYFEDDFRVVLVDRDPRDVYLQLHYRGCGERIPTELKAFVTFWRRQRENEKRIDDPRIIRIRLEDLIYRYDETKAMLENRCGLLAADHTAPREKFDPVASRKYTRIYEQNEAWREEIRYIEEQLPEYLYDYDAVL